MRKMGFFLTGVGLIWAIYAFNMSTTVSTSGFSVGGFREVHNIGLMDDRRNHLLGAGFTALIGVLLIGFGSIKQGTSSKKQLSLSDEKKMEELGITYENGIYRFGDYAYESLSQALIHAKASKARSS